MTPKERKRLIKAVIAVFITTWLVYECFDPISDNWSKETDGDN